MQIYFMQINVLHFRKTAMKENAVAVHHITRVVYILG